MTERLHQIARDYVYEIKDFLQYTYNFKIVATAYNLNETTIMEKLNGDTIKFDLRGVFERDTESIEVFIEAKNYSSSSDLNSQYREFIKDCFSVWVRRRQLSSKWKARFLFISSHPFYCSDFANLKSLDFLSNIIQPSDEELYNYLSTHKEEVIKDFLGLVDVLILSPSRTLISINFPKIMEIARLFR